MPTRSSPSSLLTRSYRHLVDALPMSVRRRVRYRKVFGRWPSLRDPRTFTEKVTWRIVKDRRPLLQHTCDKIWMKQYAERIAHPGVRVPRLRWHGTDLARLAEVDLPEHWVLKPNHRSGVVHLGSGRPDPAALAELTAGWLDPVEWEEGGEWAYSQAQRVYLVEDRIGEPGATLVDYKFYVFDGVVRCVQTDTDRFGSHGSRMYSPDWRFLAKTQRFPAGPEVPRPALLEPMIEAASALGAGFDFIRVDLYEHDGEIWFGELTPYPGSGLVGWDPQHVDREVADHWVLPRLR